MKIAVPSSNYHKNFCCSLINDFILTMRSECKNNNIDCVCIDQEKYANFLTTKNKPFDILISMGFTSLTDDLVDFYKSKNIKIIVFQDDIHGKNNSDFNRKKKWFNVADILLIPYYKNFMSMKEYSSIHNKAIEFPWFAPRKILPFDKKWKNRKNEILLSGCVSDIYSLRKNIRSLSSTNKYINVLMHPGYKNSKQKHNIIGEKYYSYLRSYKSAICTSADAPLNYPLSKYFEVPSCGCLGIFEKIDCLEDFGFVESEHYVSINSKSYKTKLDHIAKNINDFEHVARNCYELIKNNHTCLHRAKRLISILTEL